tara:strand:+ start:215 stop:646 length:432 start_codon:yes stop_codon:yes gene_type:complete
MYDKDYILTLVKKFKDNTNNISDNEVELIKDNYYNNVINLIFIPRNYLLVGYDKKPNQIYFKSMLQNDYIVIFNYMENIFYIAHIKDKNNSVNTNSTDNTSVYKPNYLEYNIELSNNLSISDSSSSTLINNQKKKYCGYCIIN